MAIRWTTERASSWRDGDRADFDVRVARRWRVRAISDRRTTRPGAPPPMEDFDAIVTDDLDLWFRGFGSGDPFVREASGAGVSIQVVANITIGVRHEVTVRIKPGDGAAARWSCSCGVTSRGVLSPDFAREAADAHAMFSLDGRTRSRDVAVAQGIDGAWAEREVAIACRHHVCVRSDLSTVVVHRKGHGEDFELAVDGALELWVRRLGSDAALRKDEDARGVSILAFDDLA